MHYPAPTKELSLFVGALVVLQAPLGWAQSSDDNRNMSGVIDEVIVTAQKREQNLQEVPLSVEVVSGDLIQEQQIFDMEALSDYVPNLLVSSSDQVGTITIRGFGSGLNTGFEQSVGMYVDGVFYGRQQHYRGALFDLERVEVLRGPQGILFGKNTIAGAINVTSAKPSEDFAARLSTSVGSFGEYKLAGMITGPLSDNTYGRLALESQQRDSYLDNSAGEDGGAFESLALRASLLRTFDDDTQVITRLELGRYDEDGTVMQINGDRQLADEPSEGNFVDAVLAADPSADFTFDDRQSIGGLGDTSTRSEKIGTNVEVSKPLGDYTLTSVTALYQFEQDDQVDNDFTPAPLFFHRVDEEYRQFSQELRLESPLGQEFEYVIGGYLQANKLQSKQRVTTNIVLPIDNTTTYMDRSYEEDGRLFATFAALTWNLNERLHATLGLRWGKENKQASYDLTLLNDEFQSFTDFEKLFLSFFASELSVEPERDETSLMPMFHLAYDFSDDVMIYGRVSKGQKGGGFNAELLTGDVGNLEFEDEEATAYELGFKTMLLGQQLRLNGAIFRMDYDDLQVGTLQNLSVIVTNAAQAHSEGLELDLTWQATEQLGLGLSYAYLRAEFDDYPNAPSQVLDTNPFAEAQSLGGQVLPYAPEQQMSAFIQYQRRLADRYWLDTRLIANYTDDYFTQGDLDPYDQQAAFTKWNARVALSQVDQGWQLALIGRNLTDETTTSYSSDVPGGGGATSGLHAAATDLPRTIALELQWDFD